VKSMKDSEHRAATLKAVVHKMAHRAARKNPTCTEIAVVREEDIALEVVAAVVAHRDRVDTAQVVVVVAEVVELALVAAPAPASVVDRALVAVVLGNEESKIREWHLAFALAAVVAFDTFDTFSDPVRTISFPCAPFVPSC
jgi:hypothetical protein